jgi:hypothetical protein
MGRSLTNAVFNLGIDGPYAEAVKKMGYKMEELVDAEQNAVRNLFLFISDACWCQDVPVS